MSASTRKYMSKRQRPCDFCRSRKTACRIEGQLPCRLCSLHGRQCTFLEAAQPRKRPTASTLAEGTVSTAEIPSVNPLARASPDSLGHAISPAGPSPRQQEIDFGASPEGLQQGRSMSNAPDPSLMFDNLAEHFFNDLERDAPEFQFGQSQSDPNRQQSPQSLFVGMENQSSPTWLDDNSKEIQLDRHDGLNPQILGHSGDMDPYLLQNYRYDISGSYKFKQLSIQSVCQGNTPTQFLISQPGLLTSSRREMGHRQISSDILREELETLVPVDTGLRLISLFRKFILAQYPIFADNSFPNPRSSPPYLLAAIYLITQPFTRFDDVLSIELAYETLNNQALHKLIDEAMRFEAHDPSLSVVQTLLLLVIRPSANPLVLENSLKWSLHGTLVATSQNLGLQYDPTSWNIAPWQIALRRRLSSTIYTVDKWLACSLGRSPLITEESWLVTKLHQADNLSSTLSLEFWCAHDCYTRVGVLLGEVLSKLFSLRALNEAATNTRKHLDVSKELLQKLSDWEMNFMQLSSIIPGETESEVQSIHAISSLGSHYVKMTIYRAIIRPFVANLASNDWPVDMRNEFSTDFQDILGFARKGVRTATTAAARLTKGLQQERSQIFWPQWSQVAFSSICFLDLMMAISSPDTQEALEWFQDLHSIRKEMRLKSNMLPVLRLGVLRIDAVFWKGVDKVLHLPPHVEQALKASLESNAA